MKSDTASQVKSLEPASNWGGNPFLSHFFVIQKGLGGVTEVYA